jgi:hypothetical protein
MRFAKRGQRVNAFTEIDRLVSEKDFEMRDELNHQSQKRRKSEQREASKTGAGEGRRRVSRVPSGRSSKRRQAVGVGSAVVGKKVGGRGKKESAGAGAERGEGEAESLPFLRMSRGGGDFLGGGGWRERG